VLEEAGLLARGISLSPATTAVHAPRGDQAPSNVGPGQCLAATRASEGRPLLAKLILCSVKYTLERLRDMLQPQSADTIDSCDTVCRHVCRANTLRI